QPGQELRAADEPRAGIAAGADARTDWDLDGHAVASGLSSGRRTDAYGSASNFALQCSEQRYTVRPSCSETYAFLRSTRIPHTGSVAPRRIVIANRTPKTTSPSTLKTSL